MTNRNWPIRKYSRDDCEQCPFMPTNYLTLVWDDKFASYAWMLALSTCPTKWEFCLESYLLFYKPEHPLCSHILVHLVAATQPASAAAVRWSVQVFPVSGSLASIYYEWDLLSTKSLHWKKRYSTWISAEFHFSWITSTGGILSPTPFIEVLPSLVVKVLLKNRRAIAFPLRPKNSQEQ